MITGKDLIALGYKPSKWFKEAIDYANQHELSGKLLVDYLKEVSPKIVEPRDAPIPFHQNIQAEDEDEILNVESVIATMN